MYSNGFDQTSAQTYEVVAIICKSGVFTTSTMMIMNVPFHIVIVQGVEAKSISFNIQGDPLALIVREIN